MQKELWQETKKRFDWTMKIQLPVFARNRKERLEGNVLYEYKPFPKLAFFVCLRRANAYDQFTIELGWSAKGKRFSLLYQTTRYGQELETDGCIIRLGRIWNPKKDAWWGVAELDDPLAKRFKQLRTADPEKVKFQEGATVGLKRIPVLVDDAVEQIIKFGLPYFEKVAEVKGFEWKNPLDFA